MAYEFRTPTGADWDEISHLIYDAFNDDFDEVGSAVEGNVFEPERAVVATLDGTIAGHAASFTRDIAVPGGFVSAAHVTMVGVAATHRRQGLLTTMITKLHQDASDRREPIAVLWASEGKIYQRYGYGLAAQKLAIEGRCSELSWLAPKSAESGRVRVAPLTAVDEFRSVYDATWRTRPGWSSRNDRWWDFALADPASRRWGGTALRAVVHEDASGALDGYLLWRVKGDWDDSGPNGIVQMRELVTTNPIAYRALWDFAFSVDLTRNFRFGFAATDEPLQFMTNEPRRMQAKLSDALWVRVLDVPKALEGRRYAAPVDVVIEVTDDRLPANNGRWHLTGSPTTASCTAADTPADLLVEIGALGAAYLGGTSLSALAAAGRVQELREGTLAPTSAAFTGDRDPNAIEVF